MRQHEGIRLHSFAAGETTPLTCDLLISITASRNSISSYALTIGSSATKNSDMTAKASQLYPISGKNFQMHDRKLSQTHQ